VFVDGQWIHGQGWFPRRRGVIAYAPMAPKSPKYGIPSRSARYILVGFSLTLCAALYRLVYRKLQLRES
jgi:hypothetical protein